MNHKDHDDHEGRVHAAVDAEVERIVREVIGGGLAVHRQLGPGFVECVYDQAVAVELLFRGVSFEQQSKVEVRYRGQAVAQHRLDLSRGAWLWR